MATKKKALRVYYGWAKLNKVVKREALTVIFLNDSTGTRIGKDGSDGVTRFMNICAQRFQTDAEMSDAEHYNRIYSVYNIFLDDKKINGSLNAALEANFDADKNHVRQSERKAIMEKLREGFMRLHPNYQEPKRQRYIQLELFT